MKRGNLKKNTKTDTTDIIHSDRAIFGYVDILVEKVNVKIENIDARVDELSYKFEKLSIKVDELSNKFEKLDARVEQLNQKFEDKFESINAKLDSIIEMVVGMAEDMFSIKSWIKEHEQVTHKSIEFRLNSIESSAKTIEVSK